FSSRIKPSPLPPKPPPPPSSSFPCFPSRSLPHEIFSSRDCTPLPYIYSPLSDAFFLLRVVKTLARYSAGRANIRSRPILYIYFPVLAGGPMSRRSATHTIPNSISISPSPNHLVLLAILTLAVAASAQSKPRARDLGVPFDGTPGPNNAITDVAGVEVGFTTLISGSGKLVVGKGPVRTGVTAVLPRGKGSINDPVFAGWYSLNGNGEMTGTTWVEESGFLEGPVMITNTHSVGVVRDAVIQWRVTHGQPDASGYWWSLPVVAETWDGWLNDINGFHVKPEHAFHAIDSAQSGHVDEGNVGGGTGMVCSGYKGGIGTASRKLSEK